MRRFFPLFLAVSFSVAQGIARPANAPQTNQNVRVERHLTGQEQEPWEMLYFKIYKNQLQVIEKALETASLMLGSQRTRGYCSEMICADFLTGAQLEGRGSSALLLALDRLYSLLPALRKLEFLRQVETA